jgi:hypothetical protein
LAALLGLLLVLVIALGGSTIVPHYYANRAIREREYETAKWWLGVARRLDFDNAETEFLTARIARHEERLPEMEEHLRRARQFGMDAQRIKREELLVMAARGELRGVEEPLRNGWRMRKATSRRFATH